MSAPPGDAYRHYVTQLTGLHAAARRPTAAKFSSEIFTAYNKMVPPSTIKGWLAENDAPRRIPRDGAQLALALGVLHRLAGRRFDGHIPQQWEIWRNNASRLSSRALPAPRSGADVDFAADGGESVDGAAGLFDVTSASVCQMAPHFRSATTSASALRNWVGAHSIE